MLRALTLIVALASSAPAGAQEVPPDADKLLWCASAFYWLAGSAEDSGDAEEAETYDRWSKRLLEITETTLAAAGYPADQVEALVSGYVERVLGELGTEKASYDIMDCPQLLGDWR